MRRLTTTQVVKDRLPTIEEFLRLRREAGWPVPEADAVEAALADTLYSVVIEKDGECIGNARVVGDGALVFYVQDVIVLPEQQRRGLGTMLMDAVMAYINQTARKGAVIGLMSPKGIEPWYARYGFLVRDGAERGYGMAFLKS